MEDEMNLRRMAFALILSVTVACVAVRAQSGEPGDCSNDSKLLNGGPTAVFGDGPNTWWGLVTDGLNQTGLDEQGQIDYLNHIFGTNFDNLNALKTYNLDLLEDAWDKNHNGFICAYELRGTRAYLDDPFDNLTFFGVSDDKIAKK
jgi:hypothetical protein